MIGIGPAEALFLQPEPLHLLLECRTYNYDGIGNRLSSTSPILGDHTYTPNALNQYASLTTGNTRTAIGRAPAAWTVQVAGVAASRTGELYHRSMTASNSAVPVWQSVVTRRDTGTPTMTTNFWYAKASFSPTYDLDGNLTNDGRWVYVWNAENRLIQMETTSQATAAGHPYTKLVFVYDWMGRRIARHVWRGGSQASPTFKSSHRWLYDGWNVITEFTAPSSSSTSLTRASLYTWGIDLSGTLQGAGGVGGLVSQTTVANGVKERASYDGNGNIIAWTKSDQSAPTSRREYDAFGNTLVSEGTTPCSFGFSTKMQDVETGLYYYGYRFYDAEHGRWLNRDPIQERGGVNLYGFVNNQPVLYFDLLGMRTRGEAVQAAAKMVGNLTKASREAGKKEFEGHFRDFAPANFIEEHLVDNSVNYRIYQRAFIDPESAEVMKLPKFGYLEIVMGVEYAVGVYCCKQNGKDEYLLGEPLRGSLVELRTFIQRTVGTTTTNVTPPATCPSAKLEDFVHSHNFWLGAIRESGIEDLRIFNGGPSDADRNAAKSLGVPVHSVVENDKGEYSIDTANPNQ